MGRVADRSAHRDQQFIEGNATFHLRLHLDELRGLLPLSVGDPPEADPPEHFDEYELVLLWSARDRAELEPEAAQRIQRQHLGHLEAMRAAGHLLVAGPLLGQPDERLRGICIYRMGSVTATLEAASSDPAVRGGQLEVEAMTWRTRPGALAIGGD